MNTLNLVLTIVLIGLICLMLGYNAGKIAGRQELTKGLGSMVDNLGKMANLGNPGEKEKK